MVTPQDERPTLPRNRWTDEECRLLGWLDQLKEEALTAAKVGVTGWSVTE